MFIAHICIFFGYEAQFSSMIEDTCLRLIPRWRAKKLLTTPRGVQDPATRGNFGLATAPADEGLVIRDIWLLRLRALLARAHGDAAAYADFRDRYRDMATSLGFEGHMKWAEAMP